MKSLGVAFVAALAGALVGSLAAQGPRDGASAPAGEGLIFQGPVKTLTYSHEAAGGGRYSFTSDPGTTASVYPGWVVLPDKGTFIPASQVESLSFGENVESEPAGDFGADPQPEKPRRPNTFRED